jgi:hypothetical protein
MNAVERLWRALAQHDWAAAQSQFRPHATVTWPPGGEVVGVAEYLSRVRERDVADVEVLQVVVEGRYVAVEARMGDARGAAFYDLHDGLIVSATEYWAGDPG